MRRNLSFARGPPPPPWLFRAQPSLSGPAGKWVPSPGGRLRQNVGGFLRASSLPRKTPECQPPAKGRGLARDVLFAAEGARAGEEAANSCRGRGRRAIERGRLAATKAGRCLLTGKGSPALSRHRLQDVGDQRKGSYWQKGSS